MTAPARSVLATDADTWIDTNRDYTRDAAETGGPVALAAIVEFGTGRIAVLSDDPFDNSRPVYFVLEVVRWLLRL